MRNTESERLSEEGDAQVLKRMQMRIMTGRQAPFLRAVVPNKERDFTVRPPEAAGFSLVEVLIALALLLIVFVGIAPLFMRGMVDNVAGKNSSPELWTWIFLPMETLRGR